VPEQLQRRASRPLITERRRLQDAILESSFPTGNLRDAVMIAHMQRAEHYKMAAYTSVHDYAKLLGDKEGADRLNQAGKAVWESAGRSVRSRFRLTLRLTSTHG